MENGCLDIKGINIPKTKLGQTKMDKLLAASEELFATKGFYSTSISDICKHAGLLVRFTSILKQKPTFIDTLWRPTRPK